MLTFNFWATELRGANGSTDVRGAGKRDAVGLISFLLPVMASFQFVRRAPDFLVVSQQSLAGAWKAWNFLTRSPSLTAIDSARTPFPWDASSQLHRVLGQQFEEFKLDLKPDKIVPENKGQFNSLVGRTMVVDLGGNW